MANDIFRTAEEGNRRLLSIMEELNTTPGSSTIQGIDLTSHFISFWDENYRLLRLNNSCFSRCLVNHNLPDDQIFGLPVTDYFPDVDRDALRTIHQEGGIYTVDNYRLAGHNLDTSIHIELTVSKVNNVTVLMGEDLTDSVAHLELLEEFKKQIDALEDKERDMNVAIDVLLRRMQDKEREIRENYRREIESAILPLLLTLESTGLKGDQQEMVNEISRLVMGANGGREPQFIHLSNGDLTAREREIISLIKMGKTTKEISTMLCLSTKTVDSHRASIRRKLGLPERGVSLYQFLNSATAIDPVSRPQ
ncbi:MAG: LuxR family transcriptional regulator [Coriobacteriales bacterium]|nr:LuxR family transcriptional regulator [Coriobacteriales bacterium]